MSSKPRVVKSYENLDEAIVEQLKLQYPYGFDKKLTLIPAPGGKLISVLPFETEDKYYLIKMTREQAYRIILNDDDYDDDGHLKKAARLEYEDKYDDDDDDDDDDLDFDDDFGDEDMGDVNEED